MIRRLRAPLSPGQVLLPLGLGTALSLMGDATMYTVLPTHTAAAGIALSSVGILLGANRAVRILLKGGDPSPIAQGLTGPFQAKWDEILAAIEE